METRRDLSLVVFIWATALAGLAGLALAGCGEAPDEAVPEARAAEAAPVASDFTVLDFRNDGQLHHKNVYHGRFFRTGISLGPWHADGWVQPRLGAAYWLIDDFSGAHASAVGFVSNATELFQMCWMANPSAGNTVQVYGDDPVAPGETHLSSCQWDGQVVRIWKNGILTARVSWAGVRTASAIGSGSGALWVAGTDHSNFVGRLSQIRYFDGTLDPNNVPRFGDAAFPVQDNLTGSFPIGVSQFPQANFLVDYTDPLATVYEDVSPLGFSGGDPTAPWARHPGTPGEGLNYGNGNGPVAVRDPSFPHGRDGVAPPALPQPPVPAAAPGVVAADTFTRGDQNTAFGRAPTLGAAETGQAWQTAGLGPIGYTPKPAWGIADHRAVYLGSTPGIAWVDAGISDGVARVSRRLGRSNLGRQWTGLSYRVRDGKNACYAWATESTVRLGCMSGNAWVSDTSAPVPAGLAWTDLEVEARGSSVTARVCGTSCTEIQSKTDSWNLEATGWGLSHLGDSARAASSLVRYDNFSVRP